jgi:hypothetical protein
MTTIFEITTTALSSLSPTVPFALGAYKTVNGADLPDVYIAYSLIDGSGAQHADDAETLREYLVQVSIFSRSGLASLPDVDSAMTGEGFTKGPERQLPTNEQTRHFGLAKDYLFYLSDQESEEE